MGLLDNLLAHWKLNSNGDDSHTNNYDLTLVNGGAANTFPAGKIGNAIFFDNAGLSGSSGYGHLSGLAEPSISRTERTIVFWLKLVTPVNGAATVEPIIGANLDGSTTSERWYLYYDYFDGKFNFVVGDNDNIVAYPPTAEGSWWFICARWKEGDKINVTINDSVNEDDTLVGAPSDIADLANFQINYINNRENIYVDAVSLYDRYIDDDEVVLHYNSGSGLDYDSFLSVSVEEEAESTTSFSSTANVVSTRQSLAETILFTVEARANINSTGIASSTITFSQTVVRNNTEHISITDTLAFGYSVKQNLGISQSLAHTIIFTPTGSPKAPYYLTASSTLILLPFIFRDAKPIDVTAVGFISFFGSVKTNIQPVSADNVIAFTDSFINKGPVIVSADNEILFDCSNNEIYAVDIENSIIFDSIAKNSILVIVTASNDLIFTLTVAKAGPVLGTASADIDFSDSVDLSGVYDRLLIECIYFETRGGREFTQSLSHTITLTIVGIQTKWELPSSVITLTDTVDILGLPFSEFVCGTTDLDTIVNLNGPANDQDLSFSDSVIVQVIGSKGLSNTITFGVFAIGLIIRTRR